MNANTSILVTQEKLQCLLVGQLHAAANDVSVVVESGGRVVLTGSVASYYQKQLAQEAIRQLSGVSQVVNNISVPVARDSKDQAEMKQLDTGCQMAAEKKAKASE